MNISQKSFLSGRIITYEFIAFLLIILIIWLDELIDIPALIFFAPNTPPNWKEALFESLTVAIIGGFVLYYTNKMFKRIKMLEGVLPVCSSCKKIRDDKGAWQQIELYISDNSEVEFSHGLCPECAERLYPEFYKKK